MPLESDILRLRPIELSKLRARKRCYLDVVGRAVFRNSADPEFPVVDGRRHAQEFVRPESESDEWKRVLRNKHERKFCVTRFSAKNVPRNRFYKFCETCTISVKLRRNNRFRRSYKIDTVFGKNERNLAQF